MTQQIPTEDDLDRFDPGLDEALCDALSAESVPGGIAEDLADRIVAQTHGQLVPSRSPVIARIHSRWFGAVAAAAVIAVAMGISLMFSSPVETFGPVASVFATGSDMNASIDREIELLDMEIELALSEGSSNFDGNLLDDEMTEWELDFYENMSDLF